jgi:hypothetical protein
LEIFKDVINASTCPLNGNENPNSNLKPRYVTAVILEFLRTLLENSIP